ncbi:DUF438 domain-containing protein [Desulfuribacillus alkaliarsenatis]|uniref:PAS domain S-box protein n=1 Tax=Desulfuribacillus alkaliarsenatis TaxID=766136 RepID=A0A1E5G4P9_9FIRM|nr:DUF438 domain-containing protein [Desulfuribacillus alkaliarsenatis]OEF98151.1 PAS domain S-box protein [Desulfuribacillus alkaliarsenatis]
MSELINNSEKRKEELKNLIKKLHQGVPFDDVKNEFLIKFGTVSTIEIAQMEQQLMQEGMSADVIRKLCDVHAEVFRNNIEEVQRPTKNYDDQPGHPIHTFKLENREIEKVVSSLEQVVSEYEKDPTMDNGYKVLEQLNLLWDIDKHYSRKENLLFPYMEKHGVTGPAKVMWGADDEIRGLIKAAIKLLKDTDDNRTEVLANISSAVEKVKSMIFKEEDILLPTATRFLTDEEWYKIALESEEVGYCLTSPEAKWRPANVSDADVDQAQTPSGYIRFETGILTVKEISAIFNHLPIDITYVDKDDIVKYFSHGEDRVFMRTKSIIGRNVSNCHPPHSVHIVEKLVADFKSGKKDSEDFWIPLGDMFVLIRYFAVRDENGEFMGTIEVTQNIKHIQTITGEKRLLSE